MYQLALDLIGEGELLAKELRNLLAVSALLPPLLTPITTCYSTDGDERVEERVEQVGRVGDGEVVREAIDR